MQVIAVIKSDVSHFVMIHIQSTSLPVAPLNNTLLYQKTINRLTFTVSRVGGVALPVML